MSEQPDIVDELLEVHALRDDQSVESLAKRAADEIERLRRQVRDMALTVIEYTTAEVERLRDEVPDE